MMKSFFNKIDLSGFFKGVGKVFKAIFKGLGIFFTWLFKDSKNIVIVGLIAGIIFLFFKMRSRISELEKTNTNGEHKIEVYENKIGELYKQSEIDIKTIKELKNENSELSEELKSLKENPIIITKVEYMTVLDTIVVESVVYRDSDFVFNSPVTFSDDWCVINGNAVFDTKDMSSVFTFNKIRFDNKVTLDIIEKNNALYLISKSDNPYTQINTMEGVMLSPEQSKLLKKKFNKPWGVMGGFGVGLTVVEKKVKVVPAIQITVGYKFISF